MCAHNWAVDTGSRRSLSASSQADLKGLLLWANPPKKSLELAERRLYKSRGKSLSSREPQQAPGAHTSGHRAAKAGRKTVVASLHYHLKAVAIALWHSLSACQATKEAAAPPDGISPPASFMASKQGNGNLGCVMAGLDSRFKQHGMSYQLDHVSACSQEGQMSQGRKDCRQPLQPCLIKVPQWHKSLEGTIVGGSPTMTCLPSSTEGQQAVDHQHHTQLMSVSPV